MIFVIEYYKSDNTLFNKVVILRGGGAQGARTTLETLLKPSYNTFETHWKHS